MLEHITEVPLAALRIANANTRKDTGAGQEDSDIEGLAQSIRSHGLINPLTVRPLGDGTYEIIAGQRRFEACKQLGFEVVRVTIRVKESGTSAVAISLIENVQRADMHPMDKARAYEELLNGSSIEQVEAATGVTAPTIRKYLSLLRLPEELRDAVGTGQGSAGVGAMSAIANTFDDPEDMVEAFDQTSGFTQRIQGEILKRSDGDVDKLPELVLQATEGAFDVQRCGSSAGECPHIPVELRGPLLAAMRALEEKKAEPAQSLREFAASHKKRPR